MADLRRLRQDACDAAGSHGVRTVRKAVLWEDRGKEGETALESEFYSLHNFARGRPYF